MPIASSHPPRRGEATTGRRHRASALAAAGALIAAMAPTLLSTSTATAAVPACVPATFTATASADLLRVSLLDVAPLGLASGPLASLTIGHATADMAHARADHASATADYVRAAVAGRSLPATLLNARAQQDAPPSHALPDEHSTAKLVSGLLDLGVGNVRASAGQPGALSCAVASSNASVADARVLPGTGDHSLLALPTALNGTAATALITRDGHVASSAAAGTGLAEVDLFDGTPGAVGVQVVTEPTLRGIATGRVATSSVSYTSPVLNVTLPGGHHVTVDGAHAKLDFVTPASARVVSSLTRSLSLPAGSTGPVGGAVGSQLELRLSIGNLTKSITRTSVSADAATLRLQVLTAPAGTPNGLVTNAITNGKTVLDVGIGVLSVTATAPSAPAPGAGGYGSPAPTPSTIPSTVPSTPPVVVPSTGSSSPGTVPTGPPSLPVTGSNTVWIVGLATVLLLFGRFLVVMARRRSGD